MSESALLSSAVHCVFRRGSTWFALPAASLCEVCECPPVVTIPGSSPSLAGLCHVRSEFTPVMCLNKLLSEDIARLGDAGKLLVMQSGDGAWGVLADEVRTLVSLEPSAGEEVTDTESWSKAIIGWAAWESQSVRVLDPGNLRDLLEQELAQRWFAASFAPNSAQESN